MLKVLATPLGLCACRLAASANCVVTDPTGTPLNICEEPNGKIVGTLRNGASVKILSTTYDSDGKLWANIGVGWVFRESISCY